MIQKYIRGILQTRNKFESLKQYLNFITKI